MIDFSLSSENLEWQGKVQNFVSENILHRRDLDRNGFFPWDLYQKAFDEGIITSIIPKEFGGNEKSLMSNILAAEQASYGDLGFTTSAFLMRLSLIPILKFGTTEQKNKWVRPLSEKLSFVSFCFTEHEGSTNLGSRPASTLAQKTNEGFIINGSKWTISNGSVASLYVVFARMSDQNSGLSCFIIPRDFEGVTPGTPHKKMGQRAADTAEVHFKNVKIPQDYLIGRIGEGAQIALTALRQSRVGIGAMALGVSQRARDLAKVHCHTRKDGDGKPIIYQQSVKFRFAEIDAKIEMLRAFVYKAVWEMEHGNQATLYSSSLKLLGARIANEITNECLDLHGGNGYLQDSLIEKLVRDSKLLQIYEGTEAVQKLMISDTAIRLPRRLRS